MLNTKVKNTLKQIVRKYLPDESYKAFVFGSRATGKNRKFSDIDLGIDGPKKLSPREYVSIKNDFEESNIPYRIDLVDFTNVSDKFKKISLNNIIYI